MSLKLDEEESTSLSQDVTSRQSTITIGVFGNIAHGKSTVVRAISDVQTHRFQSERKRNMTIKLGYANAKIYKCDNISCPRPGCYRSCGSSKEDVFACDRPGCSGKFRIIRHVSFLDCPGADVLLATTLNGAAVMDAAFIIIACNQPCPQPQTSEHLAVVEIMKLKHILILQNKIDLVKESQTREEHYEQMLSCVRGTLAEGRPVIPVSAHFKQNIADICECITTIPLPKRDLLSEPKLIVIRSFDINKPGTDVDGLKGGVLGGSVLRGVLKISQEIEIRPGIVSRNSDGKIECRPIKSRIQSLFAEQNELQYAVPGGLIGVRTKIDPSLCKADKMVGQILGVVGHLPDIYIELTVFHFLLRRLIGVKVSEGKKPHKVRQLMTHEVLMLNIGSLTTGGHVVAVKADLAKIALSTPACTDIGEKIMLSRKVEKHWRLIGWGVIRDGIKVEPIT